MSNIGSYFFANRTNYPHPPSTMYIVSEHSTVVICHPSRGSCRQSQRPTWTQKKGSCHWTSDREPWGKGQIYSQWFWPSDHLWGSGSGGERLLHGHHCPRKEGDHPRKAGRAGQGMAEHYLPIVNAEEKLNISNQHGSLPRFTWQMKMTIIQCLSSTSTRVTYQKTLTWGPRWCLHGKLLR